jgi:hypothetical protein
MEKMILTDGGNLLRHCELGWYFQKPNGEFLREVSENEATFLAKNGHEIDFHFPNEHPNEFPVWKFLKSILVCDDYTNYRESMSNNGGSYSFYTFQDWFVGTVNGKTVFRYVERHTTSAEFLYDELNNQFQQDLGAFHVCNVNTPTWYNTQCQYWDDELQENVYDVFEVLEKISEVGTFEQLWKSQYEYIPSQFDDMGHYIHEPLTSEISIGLNLSTKKEIIEKLKDFGVNIREGYYRSKNPRKSWIKSTNRR